MNISRIALLTWMILLSILPFNTVSALPQHIVCNSQLLVTTPQTVSFYAGSVTEKNYLGTTSVGRLLRNNASCYSQKKIAAVVWNAVPNHPQIKRQTFSTRNKYNNRNQNVVVQYPKDFANAPHSQKAVFCRSQIFNNSKHVIKVYAGKVALNHQIAEIKPWHHFAGFSLCYANVPLIAQYDIPSSQAKLIQRFRTSKKYTDVNHLVLAEFPKNFHKTHVIKVPLLEFTVG